MRQPQIVGTQLQPSEHATSHLFSLPTLLSISQVHCGSVPLRYASLTFTDAMFEAMEQRLWAQVTRAALQLPQSRSSLRIHQSHRTSGSRQGNGLHRCFQACTRRAIKVKNPVPQRESGSISSYSQPAAELNHDVGNEEIEHYDRLVAESKDKQIRTPWHRDGSDEAPVKRQRSAGAMTKGTFLERTSTAWDPY